MKMKPEKEITPNRRNPPIRRTAIAQRLASHPASQSARQTDKKAVSPDPPHGPEAASR